MIRSSAFAETQKIRAARAALVSARTRPERREESATTRQVLCAGVDRDDSQYLPRSADAEQSSRENLPRAVSGACASKPKHVHPNVQPSSRNEVGPFAPVHVHFQPTPALLGLEREPHCLSGPWAQENFHATAHCCRFDPLRDTEGARKRRREKLESGEESS